MTINALIARKPDRFTASPCTVEKVIRLTDADYDFFSKHLLNDFPFIEENKHLMYCEDDVRHCILVMGESRPDGILVESEGYNYARYAAFVPDAQGLLLLDNLPLDMRMALETAPQIVEYLLDEMGTPGEHIFSLSDLMERFDIDLKHDIAAQDIVGHVLGKRPEIADLEFGDALVITCREPEQAMGPEMT